MPGDKTDSFKGQRGATPYVPTWMQDQIKACQHPAPRAAGMGYALCDVCGALLPDEDPDLKSKI